jgi:hypothetical protein
VVERRDNIGHKALYDDQVTVAKLRTRLLNNLGGIAYLMDTPKHFAAIAASKNTAAFGNVICATAKKDDRLWGARAAQSDSRYSPNTATDPLKRHVIIPGIIPAEAIA